MNDKSADPDASGAGAPDENAPQQKVVAAADMQSFLGRQLRAVYDDIAKQPVPDRFIELMKQLDTKAAG